MAVIGESLVQRVQSLGVRGASAVDLIAVGFSRREADANGGEEMSRNILQRFHGMRALGEAGSNDLAELTGLEGFELLRSLSLVELGRRIGASGRGPVHAIADAVDVYDLLEHLRLEKKEHFYAVLLDSKNNVLRAVQIHVGTVNMSVVGPREIFREAIREGAASLIVAHNHPSGDPTPSPEDIAVTQKLAEVGEMLDLPLLDHVIIGDRTYTSFKDEGLI